MDDYKIIVEQEHQTVAAHYDVEAKTDGGYQSEAKLEAAFISQLVAQGYDYARQVVDEAGLLRNLRRRLELLNDVTLSDAEWARLLPKISNEQMTIQDKTEMIQGKGWIIDLVMDNGQTKNIRLIDKQNVFNNRLQVINPSGEGTTIMQIVVECQKQFQERYFSMKGNEWRHLLRDYVRKVTEQPQLQEQEVFTFKMAV